MTDLDVRILSCMYTKKQINCSMDSNMVMSLCTVLKQLHDIFHMYLDIVGHLIIIFRCFGKNVSVGSTIGL